MKKLYLSKLLLIAFNFAAYSQLKSIHGEVELQAAATSNNAVPFWMRSNQYGSTPSTGKSANLVYYGYKDYDNSKRKLIDWGVSFEGRMNLNKAGSFTLIEGFGKLRLGHLEFKAGRTKETMGLVDSTLSSGAFSISGNALGIPKVQLALPNYTYLPYKQLIAVKGNIAHGWLGETTINNSARKTSYTVPTFFHQTSLYVRLGKPSSKIKLYGGFNHQVIWSFENVPENPFKSKLKSLGYVFLGKTYNNYSKIGNHLGSIDLGFDYDFEKIKLSVYRQNLSDKDALAHLQNIYDGLNGVSITNKAVDNHTIRWKKVLFEVLNTRNQAGYSWSRTTFFGNEDYYNNYLYTDGWSYKKANLGSPFLTSQATIKQELIGDQKQFFVNNRVLAFHIGFKGMIKKINITGKVSYSANYGTFKTSFNYLDASMASNPGYKHLDQLSTFLEGKYEIKPGMHVAIATAADYGSLLQNSAGIICKLSKTL